MGRKRQPAATLAFRYDQGPPKRIRVTLRAADGRTLSDSLSTREARGAAALLIAAIDKAEADKIALRADPTRKAQPPKRTGARGLTKARAVRPPSRAKRIEAAATLLCADVDAERLPPTTRAALQALMRELGVTPKGLSR